MNDRFASVLGVLMVASFLFGVFLLAKQFGPSLMEWCRTPLRNATLNDVLGMAMFFAVLHAIWSKL